MPGPADRQPDPVRAKPSGWWHQLESLSTANLLTGGCHRHHIPGSYPPRSSQLPATTRSNSMDAWMGGWMNDLPTYRLTDWRQDKPDGQTAPDRGRVSYFCGGGTIPSVLRQTSRETHPETKAGAGIMSSGHSCSSSSSSSRSRSGYYPWVMDFGFWENLDYCCSSSPSSLSPSFFGEEQRGSHADRI